jgi:hypothetical protein
VIDTLQRDYAHVARELGKDVRPYTDWLADAVAASPLNETTCATCDRPLAEHVQTEDGLSCLMTEGRRVSNYEIHDTASGA